MLNWLLHRLEQNPLSVFWRNELEQFPDQFAEWEAEHMLVPLPARTTGSYVDYRTRRRYALLDRGNEIWGWDEDDPDEPPVRLSLRDLGRYQVNLAVLAKRVQIANALEGDPSSVHPRLLPVGASKLPGKTTHVVLGLFANAHTALDLLLSLGVRAPWLGSGVVAAFPSLRLPAGDALSLRAVGIHPTSFTSLDSLELDLSAAVASLAARQPKQSRSKRGGRWEWERNREKAKAYRGYRKAGVGAEAAARRVGEPRTTLDGWVKELEKEEADEFDELA